MDKRARLMKEAPIPKAIVTIAVPAIIGMLITSLYNLVDTLFVSSLGVSATGAVTLAFPFFMLLLSIALSIGVGTATYVSRMLGANKLDEVNKSVSTAMSLAVIFGISFTILGLIFLEPILRTFGATDTIMAHAKDYVFILLCLATVQMSNMVMNNTLRAEGSALISMIALVTGAVLNIAIDPIFIFTLKLGVKGAAIATAISQTVSFCILIQYYIRKKSIARIKFKFITITKKMIKNITKVGIPIFFMQGLQSIAVMLLISAASAYNDPAIASVGIMNRVIMMSMGVVFGFGQGFQPVAGYNIGAKQFSRVREAIKFSIIVTTIFCILSAIAFYIFSPNIMLAFNADSETQKIGVMAFRYLSYTLSFFGFSVIISVLFQAMGHGKISLILSVARQGLLYIPLILILPNVFGIDGVFMSQPIADFFMLFITIFFAVKVFREIKEKERSVNPPV